MREPATIMFAAGRHAVLCRETIVDWKTYGAGGVVVRVGGIEFSGWPDELEALGLAFVDIAERSRGAAAEARVRGLRLGDVVETSALIATLAGPIDIVDGTDATTVRDDDRCHDCGGPLHSDEGVFCRTCLADEENRIPAIAAPLAVGAA